MCLLKCVAETNRSAELVAHAASASKCIGLFRNIYNAYMFITGRPLDDDVCIRAGLTTNCLGHTTKQIVSVA